MNFQNLNFFEVDFKKKHKGLRGIIKLFKELTKLKPTHIADLHSVLRTHVLYWLFKFRFYKLKELTNQDLKEKNCLERKTRFLNL